MKLGLHVPIAALVITIAIWLFAFLAVPGEYQGIPFWLTMNILTGSVWVIALITAGARHDFESPKDPVNAALLIPIVILYLVISMVTIAGYVIFENAAEAVGTYDTILSAVLILEAALMFVFGYLINISMGRENKPVEITRQEAKQKIEAEELSKLHHSLMNLKCRSAETSLMRDKLVKKIELIQTRLSRTITSRDGVFVDNDGIYIADRLSELDNTTSKLSIHGDTDKAVAALSILVDKLDFDTQQGTLK